MTANRTFTNTVSDAIYDASNILTTVSVPTEAVEATATDEDIQPIF